MPEIMPHPRPSPEWWELPTADPLRPMLPDEAARYLQLRPPRYADPVKTICRWAQDGQIKCIKTGKEVKFTLQILRDFSADQLQTPHRRRTG